jgi:methionyl-tRNA formyltransferase
MRPLKTIFAGTPAFAVPSLLTLLDHPDLDVVAVYTQPDRPAGRGQTVRESAVKLTAVAHGLPVEQPDSLRVPAALARFLAHDCELLVVTAYGQILPAAVIDAPARGAINVHASLLPRWRGAAPIQRALMAGDDETGVTIMRIVERLDAGPMLAHATLPIEVDDTGGSLHDRLATLGGRALHEALDAMMAGTLHETVQDEALVTYARKIERADRLIDWTLAAETLARQVRALNPSPLAIATLGTLTLNVVAATGIEGADARAPGTVLGASDDGIVVACGSRALRLTVVQPPGKRAMNAREFLNGYRKHLPL